jgi:hypothetical protein
MRDVGHAAGGADLHADAVKGSLCDIREFRSKGGEDCRTRIEQQDAQRGGVDLAKVPLQGTVRKLGDLTGHLNARRAGADDHERQPFSSSVGIVFELGHFESPEDAGAQLECIVDRLQARGERRVLVVAEVRAGSTGCDDE